MFKHWELRKKVLVAAALAILAGFGITIGVIATQIYINAKTLGIKHAREQAEDYAKQVDSQFRIAYTVPRHVAATVTAMQATTPLDRKASNALLENMLHDFPDAIGIWMLWEPNAFDGKDSQFRNDLPVHDLTGRYTPYFTRNGDQIKQDAMIGDPEKQKELETFRTRPGEYVPPYEKSGWGDFYLSPKNRNRDTVTEPFYYEVQGKKVLESSLAVAIRDRQGRFIGVSAIDLPLDGLQKKIGTYKPFDTGHVELISNGGLYVVAGDKAKQGQPIDQKLYPKDLFEDLRSNKPRDFILDGNVHVWQPVEIGFTGQNWYLGIIIPEAAITAEASSARNQAIAIGIVATVLILVMLSLLLTALTRPLSRLADAMSKLSSGKGDLTKRLNVEANDEIGRTSEAFNRFLANLSEMLKDVKDRSDSVSSATGELNSIAHQVANASDRQAAAASATAASVEQVTVSIQHIADTAREFRRTAEQTNQATAHGKRSLPM